MNSTKVRDGLIAHAKLYLHRRVDPITTKQLAEHLHEISGTPLKEVYAVLRYCAKLQLAAFARKSAPIKKHMYGREIETRPWLWADYGIAGPDAIAICPLCKRPLREESHEAGS